MEIAFIVILGLIIGSFLNALIFRAHAGIPMTGRSKCVHCHAEIRPFDLVPVLSYMLLRGRCRACRKIISWQYPLVEASTAILFLLAFLTIGSNSVLLLIFYLVLITFLIIIFVYDARYGYILDRFSIPAMFLAVIFNLIFNYQSVYSMIAGAIVIGGFFAVQYFFSKGKWIGDGDIRMGVLMGLLLGLEKGLLALFLSYIIGAIIASFLLLSKKRNLHSHIPLGTFLSLGAYLALLWGDKILNFLFWL